MNNLPFKSKIFEVSDNKPIKVDLEYEINRIMSIYNNWGLKKGDLIAIDCERKFDNFLHIIASFKIGVIPVLYDYKIPMFKDYFKSINMPHITDFYKNKVKKKNKIYSNLPEDTMCIIFTSGSTKFPVGFIKSKQNLQNEAHALSLHIGKLGKLTSTVPITHMYGLTFCTILPLLNNADIHICDFFFANTLIDYIISNKIDTIVTNPVFIKLCNQLDRNENLSDTTFVTATMDLSNEEAKSFMTKFNTNLINIYGTTETGIIGIKKNTEEYWTPFSNVNINLTNNLITVNSAWISNLKVNKNKVMPVKIPHITDDYAEITNKGFKLIGRKNSFLKSAGKRISTKIIEEILKEKIPEIKYINIVINKSVTLKDEIITLYIVASKNVDKEIAELLKENFPNFHMQYIIEYVHTLIFNSLGKKLYF